MRALALAHLGFALVIYLSLLNFTAKALEISLVLSSLIILFVDFLSFREILRVTPLFLLFSIFIFVLVFFSYGLDLAILASTLAFFLTIFLTLLVGVR